MSNLSLEDQNQKLLYIIYQTPIGLIESNFDGTISQINARALELLMPLFFYQHLPGSNISHLLQIIAPGVLEQISSFTKPSGCIISQGQQQVSIIDENDEIVYRQLLFTINKLNTEDLLYVIDDITEIYEKEKEINKILLEKEIEHSKFEIASGVLHDIGNAVVGFNSYMTKIKKSIEQNDIVALENLKGFVEKNSLAFQNAIGEKKAAAVINLLNGIVNSQKQSLEELKSSVADQINTISHIEEILRIQRQYVKGQSTEREPVDILGVIKNAAAVLAGIIDQNKIKYYFTAPPILPKIKGDRTKLVQFFLNVFKNAVDSILSIQNDDRRIEACVNATECTIEVSIKDNGIGFDAQTGEQLFIRGFSTKAGGTGLGLANCRSIIEGHNGEMTITSEGPGKGATTTVIFKLNQENV